MVRIDNREAFTFDDVLLVPQYSEVESRSDVYLGTYLTKTVKIESPLVAASMDTVSSFEMFVALGEHNAVCPVHRFRTVDEQLAEIQRCGAGVFPGTFPVVATIGVGEDEKNRLLHIARQNISRVVFIDIAHGHSSLMVDMLKHAVKEYGDLIEFVPGNVATPEATKMLLDLGAAGIRCGIGGGSVCSTRVVAGAGVPQLSTILECAEVAREYGVPLMADGGIRTSGDIVKALAAGASTVMLGSLLAGCKEAPGETIKVNGGLFKIYRGSSSRGAQLSWKKKNPDAIISEGVEVPVPYKSDAGKTIRKLLGGVQSGLSYAGAFTVEELWERAVLRRVSSSSVSENLPHLMMKTSLDF